MIYFGKYLKDYLEFYNISQSEFAIRMGITQKHMNELLNGKTNITLEMAANIERLTGINSSFIINIENSRKIKDGILEQYGTIENVKKTINKEYHINELKKTNWINFKDETNIMQVCIDVLDFLKVKDFKIMPKLEQQVLFKKTGNDFNKIALWLAHCDEIVKTQKVNEYNSYNIMFLIKDLKEYAYNNNIDVETIKELLNEDGQSMHVSKNGIVFLNGEKVEQHYKPNKNIYDRFAMKQLYRETKEKIREQERKHKQTAK